MMKLSVDLGAEKRVLTVKQTRLSTGADNFIGLSVTRLECTLNKRSFIKSMNVFRSVALLHVCL